MLSTYDGFAGTRTLDAILSQIPAELQQRLTGKELGQVMSAVNTSYHNAKAACGAEVVDDCVWVENKLIPLAAIKAITIDKKTETVERRPTSYNNSTKEVFTITSYKMDYTERF